MYSFELRKESYSKYIVTLIFSLGFFIRIILLKNKNLVSLLSNRVEIATAVTSYKRLKEGLFLYEHGISPYSGGLFHQAPLLLVLFSIVKLISNSEMLVLLLYALIDIFSAWSLLDLSDSMFSKDSSLNHWKKYISVSLFLFNPYSIISCVGMSTAIFTNCFILTSLSYVQRRKSIQSIFFLALATYLSFYPIVLFPPLILILQKNDIKKKDSISRNIILFLIELLLLLLLSFITTNSWDFLSATYGAILSVSDLTPNIGLWWYFFTEIFDSFRLFFVFVFQLHIFIYIIPLCIRLRKYPFFIIIILCGLMSILKSYPSIADVVLFMSLFPFLHSIYSYMRHIFVTTICFLYCTFLGPAFYYLWTYIGSGNANFFYSITLVWNFNLSIIITDIVFAILKMEMEIERPDMKGIDVIQANY
ncbi:hypothetical protein PNEG_03128 [Pneumocystis murina B123]|uniref:GPI transamidase component GAB1 n=1 Tax=Pneumocystis murina (strain B123) TaxID=1069680 RepID=M7PDW1_PNEMU|nr:hypothetical protein PNEG_03128 [Pneumocystis murina B123]EMR08654.1 hypothetical protein PNEG_03128 [Pneumocystis murina B123]